MLTWRARSSTISLQYYKPRYNSSPRHQTYSRGISVGKANKAEFIWERRYQQSYTEAQDESNHK